MVSLALFISRMPLLLLLQGMLLMRFGMLLKAISLFGRQFHVCKRFYGLVLMRVLMVLNTKS